MAKDETSKEARAARLRTAREARYHSSAAFARAIEMGKTTYNSYESAANRYTYDQAKMFGKKLGVDADWLYFNRGRGPKKSSDLARIPVDDDGNEIGNALGGTLFVPELDSRAGANYSGGSIIEIVKKKSWGSETEELLRARWSFPKSYLRDELFISRPLILPVRGNSMEPLLFDGDRAVCDLDDTDLSQGGIFALIDDVGGIIIKQIELIRTKKNESISIRCKSANPSYDTFELALIDPVKIIGRVGTKITRVGI